jgi:HPt (histidine-containing phosphotransfer) domain-containing protein
MIAKRPPQSKQKSKNSIKKIHRVAAASRFTALAQVAARMPDQDKTGLSLPE